MPGADRDAYVAGKFPLQVQLSDSLLPLPQVSMSSIDRFGLEAEITLSEFRSEAAVTSRLLQFHRLRVRRRADFVGVLLDSDAWQELVRLVDGLQAENARLEDEAARAILAERLPGAVFEPGSSERADAIDREYERLVAERAGDVN